MDIQSATQDRSLLEALAVVSKQRHARRNELAEVISPRGEDFAAELKAVNGLAFTELWE
jgi:hypothetical protein